MQNNFQKEKEQKQRARSYIIYTLAIVAALFAIIARPNDQQKKIIQAELSHVKKQIPKQEFKTIQNTKYLDIRKTKAKAASKLQKAFSDIYGNASTQQLQANKQDLTKLLGKNFEQKIGGTTQLYTHNDETSVNFGNTDDPSRVPITVLTSYSYKNAVGKKLTTSKVFELTYNLRTDKVLDFKEVELKPVGGEQ